MFIQNVFLFITFLMCAQTRKKGVSFNETLKTYDIPVSKIFNFKIASRQLLLRIDKQIKLLDEQVIHLTELKKKYDDMFHEGFITEAYLIDKKDTIKRMIRLLKKEKQNINNLFFVEQDIITLVFKLRKEFVTENIFFNALWKNLYHFIERVKRDFNN